MWAIQSARVEPRLRLAPEFIKEVVKEGASSKKQIVFFYRNIFIFQSYQLGGLEAWKHFF